MSQESPRLFEITICDLKESNSVLDSWNRKSDGKRFKLRLTDWIILYEVALDIQSTVKDPEDLDLPLRLN